VTPKRTTSITENEPAVMVCRSRPHNHRLEAGDRRLEAGGRSHVGWCQSEPPQAPKTSRPRWCAGAVRTITDWRLETGGWRLEAGDWSYVGWCQSEPPQTPKTSRPRWCAGAVGTITDRAAHRIAPPTSLRRHRVLNRSRLIDIETAARIFIHLVVEVPSTCSVPLSAAVGEDGIYNRLP
jgi:hypothetical protein